MNYNITGYSTALFSTWFFIDELGLLFDAGDGLTAGLLQKSRKIKQAFISHADRDHLSGLSQFTQLNARPEYPKIYFPKDSGSFPALQSFLKKFNPHSLGTEWIPIKEKEEFRIKGNLFVKAIKNGHVIINPDLTKSLSYQVIEKKRKIKPEFKNVPGKDIALISKEKGQEYLTYEVRENILGYSGDSPVEDLKRWDNTKILIHEATFLTAEDSTRNDANKHSNLEEVMKMIASLNVEQLILSHFSSRYSPEEITKAILKNCKKYQIQIPVFAVLPGDLYRDILGGKPVNE